MTTKTRAEMQEEFIKAASVLTPARLVEALGMAIDDIRASGSPASVLQKVQDARAQIAALAS